jgi:putative lipoic acid-binding regulatory protein
VGSIESLSIIKINICVKMNHPFCSAGRFVSKHVHHSLQGYRHTFVEKIVLTGRQIVSSRVYDSNDKYSSSEDDVVGFGRVIRDPRKSKADVLRESLGTDKVHQEVKNINPTIMIDNENPGEWDQLDQHINEYPGERTFKAIGFGGDEFVKAMRDCVESVLGTLDDTVVQTKESSGGKYISVTFGPVVVENPEQIKDIYSKMQEDGRMKFFL